MSASNKTWLSLALLLASALSACSSIVTVDRTKIPDEMFVVPDAGSDEDAGE